MSFFSGTQRWSIEETEGDTPNARDGHSACVVYNKMYIFGGYEAKVNVDDCAKCIQEI